METSEKVRENRLRRQAKRLGLELRKSRAKTVHLDDYGHYMILNPDHNWIVRGEKFDYTMDDVEEFLTAFESDLRKERGD